MAFGFSPKYIQEFQLENLDKEHFIALAMDAFLKLDWNVGFVSENGLIAYTKFSWYSWSEEVTIKIENGIVQIKSECTGSQFMDWGKNKKNVEALIEGIEEEKSQMVYEEIEEKLIAIRTRYVPLEEDVLSKPPSSAKDNITDFFSLFKPKDGYFISPILIILNLLVFILMVVSGVNFFLPENQDLLNWGANFRPMTLEGEWWRLFTCCFLHIGILHLLLNMYALLYIGLLLEPYLGKTRFLAAYLISGIAASVASLWWNDFTVSAGASGAIFGMYGVFLALLTTNLLDNSVKKALMASIAVFVGYNILNGLKPDSGIDNAAHIGGLLSGMLIGYAFVPSLKQYENRIIKISTIGALAVLLFFSSFVVYTSLPNDLGKYEKEMERFASMEAMALEVFKLPEGTPNEKILSEIKDRGIYYWEENIKLLNGLDKLELPVVVKERNGKLKEYCELRMKSYKLVYKAVEENTDKYEGQIDLYNKRIEVIISELTGK